MTSHIEGGGVVDERAAIGSPRRRSSTLHRVAKHLVWGIGAAAVAGAALVVWLGVVDADRPLPRLVPGIIAKAVGRELATAEPAGPPIYYRHPDGEPRYTAGPSRTGDGRAFLPVLANEDVSFDEAPLADTEEVMTSSDDAERTILYYRNPMGLPDTSPVPKKDSMGMDYIPVYAGEGDDSLIALSPAKVQRTGVRTELATRRTLTLPIRAPGVLAFDERRIAVVATRTEAFVEEVASVTTGERVTAGQPLVRLYMPEIAAAGAQYLTDLGSGQKRNTTEGGRQRLENLGMPAAAIDDLEATRKVPLAVTFNAPQDGVVLERNVVAGMRMMPGEVMFRLADTSVMWAIVDVAERDLPMVAIGQTVSLRLRGYAPRSFTGTVSLIYPQINTATRTGRVRVELPNPDGVLLADMYVDAEVATGAGEAVVAVPASAVIDSGDRQVVVIDKGEGRFEPRDVKLGVRSRDHVQILDGLVEGDRVVASGTFLLDAESNLKAALSGLVASDVPQ